jgi:hypothetical protein
VFGPSIHMYIHGAHTLVFRACCMHVYRVRLEIQKALLVCLYICRALLWMHQDFLVCVCIFRALLWMHRALFVYLPKEACFFIYLLTVMLRVEGSHEALICVHPCIGLRIYIYVGLI